MKEQNKERMVKIIFQAKHSKELWKFSVPIRKHRIELAWVFLDYESFQLTELQSLHRKWKKLLKLFEI